MVLSTIVPNRDCVQYVLLYVCDIFWSLLSPQRTLRSPTMPPAPWATVQLLLTVHVATCVPSNPDIWNPGMLVGPRHLTVATGVESYEL